MENEMYHIILKKLYSKNSTDEVIINNCVQKRFLNLQFRPRFYSLKNFQNEKFKGLQFDYKNENIESILEKLKCEVQMEKFNCYEELYILLMTIFNQHPNPDIFAGVLIYYYQMPMLLLTNKEIFEDIERNPEDNYILCYDIYILKDIITNDLQYEKQKNEQIKLLNNNSSCILF